MNLGCLDVGDDLVFLNWFIETDCTALYLFWERIPSRISTTTTTTMNLLYQYPLRQPIEIPFAASCCIVTGCGFIPGFLCGPRNIAIAHPITTLGHYGA